MTSVSRTSNPLILSLMLPHLIRFKSLTSIGRLRMILSEKVIMKYAMITDILIKCFASVLWSEAMIANSQKAYFNNDNVWIQCRTLADTDLASHQGLFISRADCLFVEQSDQGPFESFLQ